ncbi:hypothetical protein KPL47_09780 [Clostridium estertheticum]|uniref:hypothetical protein n=1 Tax=Clostridium estertheticum TaxID=238834 RepID=UPI001C0E3996|nr:hypothetical protein [Clostridium estertheticum]MBU3176662.1 hypothetical protein [Clostridium estertheticum]
MVGRENRKFVKIYKEKYEEINLFGESRVTTSKCICFDEENFSHTRYADINNIFHKCKRVSKGECVIEEYLKKKNIRYKMHPRLSYKSKKYECDFFVYDDEWKLIFIIEFNGEFHHEARFVGEVALKRTKLRDDEKEQICELTNTSLISIEYWDFNQIDKILDEKLDFKYAKESELNKLWNGFDLKVD